MFDLDELTNAIQTYDPDAVRNVTEKALAAGVDPLDAVEKGLSKGIRIVGEKFGRGEIFLPHLMMAAECMKAGVEVLEPELLKLKKEVKSLGKVVIGTVAGDIHDIGKSIVATMLMAAGFEVFDLGVDVPVDEFVGKTREVGADVVCMSALLSTTMPVQRQVIEALKSEDLRSGVKVMIGGAPTTEEWMNEIGADGYAEDAVNAVRRIKELMDLT